MACEHTPFSHESMHQWNQGPVTLIYQWKKVKGGDGVKDDLKAK